MKKYDWVKLISVLLLAVIAYIPTFFWMWERWFAKESYYGHGILIPFVSLYFIWQKKDELKSLSLFSDFTGIFFIAGGLLVHVICALLKIYFISGFSFIFVLYGISLFFCGRVLTRKISFPLFFLLTMVPLPLVLVGNLTVKLKLLAARAAAFILNRIGFPCVREGSIIRMPSSFVSVGAPCSGLRSLISLLTLGLIFAYAMKASFFRRVVLFLSSVPIALAANILRITMLAVVNDLYGEKIALGFFHDFSGFLVFAFAFAGLLGIGNILDRKKNEE